MSLPILTVAVDGIHIPVARGWAADSTADGGHRSFRGTALERDVRRLQIGQGSLLQVSDGDRIVWEGRLAQPPAIHDGVADLVATGHVAAVEKSFGRLLYQVRGSQHFVAASSEPHNYTMDDVVEAEVREASLVFKLRKDHAYSVGDQNGVLIWAPGTPGGLSSYAFDIVKAMGQGNADIRVSKFKGPSGARIVVNDHSLAPAAPGAVSGSVPDTPDGLWIGLRVNTNFTPTSQRNVFRLKNIRINGISTHGVRFRSDEVASDVGERVGLDVSGVETGNVDVRPLDWTASSSWADLLDYVAMLEDYVWLVLDARRLHFRAWGRKTWNVSRAGGARVDLEPLELFNVATVAYEHLNGAPLEVTVRADPDPLAGLGIDNVISEELEDRQHNDVLATRVAENLIRQASVQRYSGTIDVTSAVDEAGTDNPYEILAGDLVRISDWGPAEDTTHRIWEVEYSDDGVRLGIEAPVSAARLIATTQLRRARRRQRLRRRRRRR